MKKYILLIIPIVMAGYGFAQTLERSVLASSGNFTSTSTMSISSTLGEVFVTTLDASSSSLTQGFQQSTTSNGGGIGIEEIENINFSVYPNPFQDVITIKSNVKGNFSLKLVDVLGRDLLVDNRNNNQNTIMNIELNLSDYQSGMYFFKIYDDSNHLKTIKIQKQ